MKGPDPAVVLFADAPVPARSIAPSLRPSDALTRLKESTASQVGFATAALLAVGVLISIATTPDPLWWQLHFSRLGTFAAFSGFAFNGTIVLTGIGVVFFAACLRRQMVRHAGTAVLANRRSATFVPIMVALLGIHLSFVGIIPLNLNEFWHDRSSTGAVFCFVILLSSSKWMLRGMHRVIARASRLIGVGLVITVVPYVAGLINLAAFELIVFVQIFYWLLLFARTIGRPADEAAPVPASRTASMHRTVVIAPAVGAAAARRRARVTPRLRPEVIARHTPRPQRRATRSTVTYGPAVRMQSARRVTAGRGDPERPVDRLTYA
jgi:hypothetical membrane protein